MSSAMSMAEQARPAFARTNLPTLADVLARLAAAPGLTPAQRRDQQSAVRTVARVAGLDPARIPVHPRPIRQLLAKLSPAAAGMTATRWRNVVSLLRTALDTAGCAVMPGRYTAPLSDDWKALLQSLPTKKLRTGLSRIAHYCSVRTIPPSAVDAAVFERFHHALVEEAIIQHPKKSHAEACRCWNAVAAILPECGLTVVPAPTRQRTYTLAWSEFPPSLKADVDAYLADLAGGARRSGHRKVGARTLQNRDWQLRQAASALVLSGVPACSLTGLHALATLDAIDNVLAFLQERAGRDKPGSDEPEIPLNLGLTAHLLTAIAEHWVKVDGDTLSELKTYCRDFPTTTTGLTERNQDQLRQFRDPNNLRKLLDLPDLLRDRAEATVPPDAQAALAMQTAVAIHLLLHAPMRIGNLAALHLTENIFRSGASACIHLPRRKVKNKVDLEFPLTPESLELIDLYLTRYRPLLPRVADSDYLFPGLTGGGKTVRALRQQIVDAIWHHTGLRVNPHFFRHLTAYVYLEANPGAYEAVRRILGHTTTRTTVNFYTGLETAAAVQHYDRLLDRHRAGTRRTVTPRGMA